MTATLPTPTRDTIAIVPFGHILVAELSIADFVILRVTEISSIQPSCMSDDEIQPIFPFQYDDISFEGVPPPQNEAIFLSVAFFQDSLRFLRKTNSCNPLLYFCSSMQQHSMNNEFPCNSGFISATVRDFCYGAILILATQIALK